MRSHVYYTVIQRGRCTGRCNVQIRNYVVCDAKKKGSAMGEHDIPLTGFVGWSAGRLTLQ